MDELDISAFAYGVLALTNPSEWPNEGDCDAFDHLVTAKSVYVWPLIFAAYTWHLKNKKTLNFLLNLKESTLT